MWRSFPAFATNNRWSCALSPSDGRRHVPAPSHSGAWLDRSCPATAHRSSRRHRYEWPWSSAHDSGSGSALPERLTAAARFRKDRAEEGRHERNGKAAPKLAGATEGPVPQPDNEIGRTKV